MGAFRVLQACAKNMAANGGGAIVQTGSVAGLRGTPTMGAYVASKAAIHGLTMTAAKDLGTTQHKGEHGHAGFDRSLVRFHVAAPE